jgi:hypothetical protein
MILGTMPTSFSTGSTYGVWWDLPVPVDHHANTSRTPIRKMNDQLMEAFEWQEGNCNAAAVMWAIGFPNTIFVVSTRSQDPTDNLLADNQMIELNRLGTRAKAVGCYLVATTLFGGFGGSTQRASTSAATMTAVPPGIFQGADLVNSFGWHTQH